MKRFGTSVRASDGVAIGRAFVVVRAAAAALPEQGSEEQERERFARAFAESDAQIEALAATSDIFAAHLEILRDDMIRDGVEELLGEGMSALDAVRTVGEQTAAMFAEIDDEYLRARVDDVRDVFARLQAYLTGGVRNPFEGAGKGDIIVAGTLTPSDTALLDLAAIGGFVTSDGSATSHVCIIARNNSIPAIVGVGDATRDIATGDTVILDASNGEVIVAPDDETLAVYRRRIEEERRLHEEEGMMAGRRFSDHDGRRIHVFGNAGSVEEVRRAIESGAEGIGLFRSEFLFMHSPSAPTEQQQYEAYAEAARICGERPLTVRTLDVGGDKEIPYLNFDKEENPFLGWRAIRVSLAMRDMFREQLRAVLRASAHGNVRVMLPMVSDVDELRQAKSIIEECKTELRSEGTAFDENMAVGIMIETPAAVFAARTLAAECDFFSIGTNDLTQYVMAADRANAKVASLYNPRSEAVTAALRMTIAAVDGAGIECGMCGEFAADTSATDHLLSLGLHEFSVGPSSVARLKYRLSQLLD